MAMRGHPGHGPLLLRPVIWLLSVSVNGVLRLLHMKVEAEEENVNRG